jgi:hypothetical protein
VQRELPTPLSATSATQLGSLCRADAFSNPSVLLVISAAVLQIDGADLRLDILRTVSAYLQDEQRSGGGRTALTFPHALTQRYPRKASFAAHPNSRFLADRSPARSSPR